MSSQTSAAAAARIDELTEAIRALNEHIEDRGKLLAEKKREHDVASIDHDEAAKAASEAEQSLAAAQEEYRIADQMRQKLIDPYQACQQNKDQHQKAEEYKKEISRTEADMREADGKIRELEAKLQKVSAEYKTEREKRSLLADRVITMLDELRTAVEEKVTLTLPIDESSVIPHASISFRAIGESAREREVSIAQCARHAAEVSAIVKMKQQRVQELRVEAERDIAALKAVKDEQIKRMVLKFDEERRCIQEDIDAVEAANADLQKQLRNTRHIAADGPSTSMAGAAVKRESARPTSSAAAKRTKELEQERSKLQSEINATALERQRLMAAMREMQTRIQEKEAEHQRVLHRYDAQIHRNKNTIAALEQENRKLADACETLVKSVQASRQTIADRPAPA